MRFFKYLFLAYSLLAASTAALAQDATEDPAAASVTGTVAEVIDVNNYTYIRLEEQGGWIATPTMEVIAGDRVEYAGGVQMGEFSSRELGRTFESIVFTGRVEVVEKGFESVHRDARVGDASGQPAIAIPVMADAPAPGEIERLEGGTTVAEILADVAQLDRRQVSLRARVLKISKNINGRNWVTLSDGSGSAPDNTLLATSVGLVSPGDLVIASGLVASDVDIGSGYRYKVLLEETTFIPGAE